LFETVSRHSGSTFWTSYQPWAASRRAADYVLDSFCLFVCV